MPWNGAVSGFMVLGMVVGLLLVLLAVGIVWLLRRGPETATVRGGISRGEYRAIREDLEACHATTPRGATAPGSGCGIGVNAGFLLVRWHRVTALASTARAPRAGRGQAPAVG